MRPEWLAGSMLFCGVGAAHLADVRCFFCWCEDTGGRAVGARSGVILASAVQLWECLWVFAVTCSGRDVNSHQTAVADV